MERACPIDVSFFLLKTSRTAITRDNISWFLLIVLPAFNCHSVTVYLCKSVLNMSFFLSRLFLPFFTWVFLVSTSDGKDLGLEFFVDMTYEC